MCAQCFGCPMRQTPSKDSLGRNGASGDSKLLNQFRESHCRPLFIHCTQWQIPSSSCVHDFKNFWTAPELPSGARRKGCTARIGSTTKVLQVKSCMPQEDIFWCTRCFARGPTGFGHVQLHPHHQQMAFSRSKGSHGRVQCWQASGGVGGGLPEQECHMACGSTTESQGGVQ